MKTLVVVLIIALFLIFFSCATHKEPASTLKASDYNAHFNKGIRLLNQKNYDAASEQFKKALDINQDSSRAHNFLGICYFQQKDYNKAKKHFEKAVEEEPSYAKAYNNLGGVYFLSKDFDKAQAVLKKAISLSPNLASSHFSLGSLLILEGKVEEGFSYLSKGIEIEPNFLEKHAHRVIAFTSPAFGSPEIFFSYAKLYATAGNIEMTLEYLEKADKAGFKEWNRIMQEKEFEKVRDDKRIIKFMRM